MTASENKLWMALRNCQFENLRFRRQHGIGPFIVDFYCAEKKLVIEVDGDIHARPNAQEQDKKREAVLVNLGLRVVRYFNDDVLNNLEGVLDDLYQKLFLPPVVPLTKGDRD